MDVGDRCSRVRWVAPATSPLDRGTRFPRTRPWPIACKITRAGARRINENDHGSGTGLQRIGGELSGDDHRFEQPIFSDVTACVRSNHAGFQHQSHAEAIDAHIVANGMQALYSSFNQRTNQVLGDAAQAEATHHDCRAVSHIRDGLLWAGY